MVLEKNFVFEYWITMPDKNDSEIFDVEEHLKSLAESDDLTKWLSDVDVSKHIADWLEEEGFKRWQVRLGLRIVTPVLLSCGKCAGKLMADTMKQRLISRIKRFDWIKDFLERLEDLQKKTDQQIEGENILKSRLESRIDRSAGDIEYRKALSLDLQAHLSQMDMLEEMKGYLDCIKGLLMPQPQFKRVFASADERDRFIYRSQYIPFVGREKELNFLHDFLYDEKRVCWQAIIGPGGIGKSRLGLEFCLRNGGAYRAGILHNLNFEFEKWIPSQPTLLVIDYATQNEERLKQILDHLSNQEDVFEYNVRVLILDRDNADSKLKDLYTDSYIRCSRHSDEPYLLNQSGVDVAEAIFDFFYVAEGEEVPEGWEDHIVKLKEIDPVMRPLFAAYFAEATAKGGCGRECSRESLLLDVIKREEEKFWKPYGVTEADKALLALATIVGGISTEYDFDSPECVTSLGELVYEKDRFKVLNCEAHGKDDVTHLIPPWEPDLVGELFVLEFLKDDEDIGVNRYRNDILNVAWIHRPNETAFFIDKVRKDYFEHPSVGILFSLPRNITELGAAYWAIAAVNFIIDYVKNGKLKLALEYYHYMTGLCSIYKSNIRVYDERCKGLFELSAYLKFGANPEFAEFCYSEFCLLFSKQDIGNKGIENLFRCAVNLVNYLAESKKYKESLGIYKIVSERIASIENEEVLLLFLELTVNIINVYTALGEVRNALCAYKKIRSYSFVGNQLKRASLAKIQAVGNLIEGCVENNFRINIAEPYGDAENVYLANKSECIAVKKTLLDAFLLCRFVETGDLNKVRYFWSQIKNAESCYAQNEDIAIAKARSAVNLMSKLRGDDSFGAGDAIKREVSLLISNFPKSKNLHLQYIKLLVNLVACYVDIGHSDAAYDVYGELKDINVKKNDNDTAYYQAAAAFSLAHYYSDNEMESNLDEIREDMLLLQDYCTSEKVAKLVAKFP
ncbi:ATP-binding protein [Marinifilum sp. JC120]|nr:ATP-binding protein [Marinifilum sp. JC120]